MENISNKNQSTAVSIYDSTEALEDFPVLKAFQQYIDAEQAKSRKRIVWISVLFGFVTILLVTFFFAIITGMSTKYETRMASAAQRNQQLNDRLVEFAMKERERPAVSSESQSVINVMKETISTLQNQIVEQQKLITTEQNRNSEIIASKNEIFEKFEKEKAQYEKIKKEENDKIKQIKRLLANEKAKLDAEKEKLRKEAVELQRRRLYPEYYARQEKASLEERSPKEDTSLSALLDDGDISRNYKKDISGAIRYFDEEETSSKQTPKRLNGTVRYFQSEESGSETEESSDSLWVIPD